MGTPMRSSSIFAPRSSIFGRFQGNYNSDKERSATQQVLKAFDTSAPVYIRSSSRTARNPSSKLCPFRTAQPGLAMAAVASPLQLQNGPTGKFSSVRDSANDLHSQPLGQKLNGMHLAAEEPAQPTASTSYPKESPLSPDDPDWALHEPVAEIDPRDANSADRWVPRHPELIRLTGRHPLNCEPSLPKVMEKGFITPVSLHYVRNHGAVPRLEWASHTVTINGLVDRPTTLRMDDIVSKFEQHTLPVTLVCAGNRRKEQNAVRRSKGFNWGPSATSTSYWTGVRLSDVLDYCGVKSRKEGACYVRFRGPVGELPQGKDGSYGTSLTRHAAMDPANDVMLAWKQNGRLLTPDHGFPIRILIPGYIGGRSVKWLSEITVSETESDNFYHFKDNRVLPPGVDHERAEAEGWWYKPEYIINELNVNSVISSPRHDENLVFGPSTLFYTVKGYAYAGGGRKVIRVEVSLDGGDSWQIANIVRNDEPTEYSKHWCWVLWDLAIPTVDLLRAKDIRCRAVDESHNMQPEKMTWNVMGMMNNPHYRVLISVSSTETGELGMAFEHPVKSGSEAGGWMEREFGVQTVAEKQAIPATKAAPDTHTLKTITMEEVEKHSSHSSAWFVHEGLVYDATPFLKEHPGGAESILIVAGQDATEEFDAIHSARAKGMLKQYLIGKLGKASQASTVQEILTPEAATAETADKVALNPRKKIAFKLSEKIALSHNSRLFRFALQSPQHRLGLPTGQHMFFYARDRGELVMRAYTPTSSDDDLGHFDLVVKVYFASQHPQFPLGGKMSQYLEKMAIGDSIEVKGPLGHFRYAGKGNYAHHDHNGIVRRMSMVAGGTGITPMFQVIKAVLKDPDDATEIRMLYANQTEDDILLRAELTEFEKDARLTIHHILSRPDKPWAGGGTGRVNAALIREHLFPSGPDTLALLCGPQGMIEQACIPNLEKLGYSKESIVVF